MLKKVIYNQGMIMVGEKRMYDLIPVPEYELEVITPSKFQEFRKKGRKDFSLCSFREGIELEHTTCYSYPVMRTFRGVNFRGLDLSLSDFESLTLAGTNFSDSDLTGANLNGIHLYRTIGNNREIKNLNPNILSKIGYTHFHICYTSERLTMGCHSDTMKWWRKASKRHLYRIEDEPVVDCLWERRREELIQELDNNPAWRTGQEST